MGRGKDGRRGEERGGGAILHGAEHCVRWMRVLSFIDSCHVGRLGVSYYLLI